MWNDGQSVCLCFIAITELKLMNFSCIHDRLPKMGRSFPVNVLCMFLEGDEDTNQHHSMDEDGGVSMGNQHHHHHLSLNEEEEEEEDVDIDVEETSDSEQTG